MAKAQHHMGGTPHILSKWGNNWGGKNIYWEGGHRTYIIEGGNNWGGDTAQH